ncbi:hypothetical protein [Paracraurococcus lichenis]|uniref:DUF3618 domain-containing protein n=1 Tax=Paracraurococcus lichenis TaxID=3064888 RepID=A0ABT9E8G5_9PROT|nr:hypothetical protein [Paracraurococcus sp. LOR1-02]MDO9712473.1 hypothetical protein [Paracraurococcus sp. LOR1-02]
MSDIPTDYQDRLNLREQLARIDNTLASTQKLISERHKFDREPWIILAAALVAALGGIIVRLPEIITALR